MLQVHQLRNVSWQGPENMSSLLQSPNLPSEIRMALTLLLQGFFKSFCKVFKNLAMCPAQAPECVKRPVSWLY